MKLSILWDIMLVAAAYYLFSYEFMMFSAEIKGYKLTAGKRLIAFFLVYLWFVVASYMELPLVINWLVFLLLLGRVVHHTIDFDVLSSYTLSLFCTISGLAVNIFFRSLFAAMLDMPLSAFDNTTGYTKMYPILFGFLFMGLLFLLLRKGRFYEKIRTMMEVRESLRFYFYIECSLYLFLIIQLLAYALTQNNTGSKVWGVKAAIFSFIVLVIANIYALRMTALHTYMNKKHEQHNRFLRDKKDIDSLWYIAYTDILTGCSNRQLLEKRLVEYAKYGGEITLGFVDLNGLKIVNDQYGHLEGDTYLIKVAKVVLSALEDSHMDLFRYGGDEFILLSNTDCEEEMRRILHRVNEQLIEEKQMYHMSISYGIVQGDSNRYQDLLRDADEEMYQYKKQFYERTARI